MKRLLCVILVVLISTTGIVFASTSLKTIQASPNTAKILVENRVLETDNFNYNGTLYVPLRAVSEELGMNVEWNQNTKTALINSNDRKFDAYVVLINEYRKITYYSLMTERLAENIKSNTSSQIRNFSDLVVEMQSAFIQNYSNWLEYNTDTYISANYGAVLEQYEKLSWLIDGVNEAKSKSGTPNNYFYEELNTLIDNSVTYGDSVFSVYMAEKGLL